MIITTYKNFKSVVGLTLLLMIVVILCRCGFETVDPNPEQQVVVLGGDTKYKVLVTTPCSFRIEVGVKIPDDYGHYRKDLHQLAGIYGEDGSLKYLRGAFGSWNSLSLNLPCGACTLPLKGMISLLDDRIDLIPWGCGKQRPPLLVDYVYSKYISPKNGAPVDKESEAQWQDTSPIYEYTYMPTTTYQEEICDGQPVLFDLKPACKVLLDAGVLGY